MSEKNDALKDVRNLLEYAKTLGMTEVRDAEPATRRTSAEKRAPAPASKPSVSEPAAKNSGPEKIADKAGALARLCAEELGDCSRCRLCTGRKSIVFGVGDPNAQLMFIGEGPGADEDEQGIPFVGRAGQLLTKIIEAMGLSREKVYIANIVKCRPPQNRAPLPDEVASCIPFLIRQARIIAPKVIVCLGSTAAQNLLGTDEKITKLRGHFTQWQEIPVMPTYHPAFLLRNPNMKKPVWEDMQLVMKLLGITPPEANTPTQ